MRPVVHAILALVVLQFSVLQFSTCAARSDESGKPSMATAIGKKISSFTLTDYQGREWKLDELVGPQGTVIAFLGTQCPLAKLYTARLRELETQFRDRGIHFVAIDSNVQDSLSEMGAHAKRFQWEMPFLKDPSQQVADQFGVTRTPEVCLLDAEQVLRYRGRVDDQYGIGYAKEKVNEHELIDAIEAVLAGTDVIVTSTTPSGCIIGRSRKPATPDLASDASQITYADQVARILQQHCVSCHRSGDIGPMDLSNYEDASAWADMLVEVTQNRTMPPWHATSEHAQFANDRRLNEDELRAIEAWAKSGAPQGDPSHTPAPLEFTNGWLLAKTPDIVLPMRDKPFSVPAKGEVKYQYFLADLKNETDLWVNGMELIPGNREVVHHILVFTREKGSRNQALHGERSFLAGYVPGTRAAMMPDGHAKRIPANSELIFQVHYTPNGTPQEDMSKIGLVVADPSTITHEIVTTSAVNTGFRIPPGEANYRTTAMLPERLPECELLSFSPHMHVRGKAFRYTLVYPDKRREILLDIPRYDFNWQTEYQLRDKLEVPKGTRIYCEAIFDNSEQNLNNPNPKSWVTWGDQTYEEMMIGYFHYAVRR
jgi:peroxiredoxin